MRNHTMSCDYPEGCSCGATEWNRLEAELAAALAANQRLEKERDNWAADNERMRFNISELRAQVASLTAERDALKEIRAKFVLDHLGRICGECGHDKDDEGKCAECLTGLLKDCPLLHTTTCNTSEVAWIQRAKLKLI